MATDTTAIHKFLSTDSIHLHLTHLCACAICQCAAAHNLEHIARKNSGFSEARQ